MTAVVVAAALGGLLAGVLVNRAAGRFPWPAPLTASAVLAPGRLAVRPPWVEAVTAFLCALAALRFGPSWELPAFLVLAATGVLLAVIDLQHRLLPNRVLLPAVGVGTALLLSAAAADDAWGPARRALLGGAVLFAVYLLLAIAAPGGMGMGDVKLAALLGLYLGWLGWPTLVWGAALGFVVQALAALGLLASRRIGLGAELPFGPAMLAGAAVAIGWGSGSLL